MCCVSQDAMIFCNNHTHVSTVFCTKDSSDIIVASKKSVAALEAPSEENGMKNVDKGR